MGWRDWTPWWAAADVTVLSLQEALGDSAHAPMQEAMMAPGGVIVDADEGAWRRLSSGQRMKTRDLQPIQQDRMLEIAWYLFEQNPFAKRLITLMTDLVVSTGLKVTAKDERVNQVLQDTWLHPVNRFDARLRSLYNAFSLNGELILPVARNPVTGIPHLGYIDPMQVDHVEFRKDNAMVPETLVLKPEMGAQTGARLAIVAPDMVTNRLTGDVFYFTANALPNSSRGRSDLLALADWLDLYDSLMFSEVERLKLLSSFVWDLQIEGGDQQMLKKRAGEFGTPQPGTVFAHNQKEKLEARTPDLQAQDRSEVARMLAIHIAGTYGFPITWLGFSDSNRATIEGQNDVLLKTPAARQQEFALHLAIIMRYAIEGAIGGNRALYRDADQAFDIQVPEIAAKDIARVGTVISSVVQSMDVAQANHTMSRRAAVLVQLAVIKQLGVELDVNEVMEQADEEGAEQQAKDDERMALLAKAQAAQQATGGFGQQGEQPQQPPQGVDGDEPQTGE